MKKLPGKRARIDILCQSGLGRIDGTAASVLPGVADCDREEDVVASAEIGWPTIDMNLEIVFQKEECEK